MIASWTVPDVKPGNGEGPWVCSTWIGIDGLRRWMKSMPQMGTTQVVGDTGEVDEHGTPLPKYFAWWQWWLLGRSIQVPVVFPLATATGKKVFCCVTLLPPDQLGEEIRGASREGRLQFFKEIVFLRMTHLPVELLDLEAGGDNT